MTRPDTPRTRRLIFWVLIAIAILILLASIFVEPLAAKRGVAVPIAAMLLIFGIILQASPAKPARDDDTSDRST